MHIVLAIGLGCVVVAALIAATRNRSDEEPVTEKQATSSTPIDEAAVASAPIEVEKSSRLAVAARASSQAKDFGPVRDADPEDLDPEVASE